MWKLMWPPNGRGVVPGPPRLGHSISTPARQNRSSCWLLATLVLLVACATDAPSTSGNPPWPTGQRLTAPASQAAFAAFALTAAGQIGAAGPQIAVAQGVGHWRLAGQTSLLTLNYGVHTGGFDIGGGFVVAPDRLTAVWLACRDGKLTHVWQAGAVGSPLQLSEASGSCQVSYVPVAQTAHIPALSLEPPQVSQGFRVEGPEVHLGPAAGDGSSGALRLHGQWLPAWVFATADCSECAKIGWHELHFLAYRRSPPQLISAIAYLHADAPLSVRIGRAIQWPQLAPLPLMNLQASWAVEP